jgi:hypothetical protein
MTIGSYLFDSMVRKFWFSFMGGGRGIVIGFVNSFEIPISMASNFVTSL